ncbi:MAG: prepilin peptidase, partial [Patescibacteria group bacterium]|nr:prepilin peptidase [Patescibacteria group bacterium]
MCPHCQHTLSAKELIPLVSFLIQKGKCKHCHEKISLQYPLVELISTL